MEATAATAVAEQARSGYEEAGVALAPSGYEDHLFWGPFFYEGVYQFPEFENCTPTGNKDNDYKIGPYLCKGYQVDIRYAKSVNSCRLLNLEGMGDKDELETFVGGQVKPNAGSWTISAASTEEQKHWSMQRRVEETLRIYGNIKKYVLQRVQDP